MTILLFCYQCLFAMDSVRTQIISVDADIIALDEAIPTKFPKAKTNEYLIVITVTNTQDTTVSIRIMTCSWDESFSFNVDSMYLYCPGCDHNYPITIEILAHKAVKFYGVLKCYKKSSYTNPLIFKIGFIDLPYDKFFKYPYSEEGKKKYKTYWSKDVYLRSRLYQYEEEKSEKN